MRSYFRDSVVEKGHIELSRLLECDPVMWRTFQEFRLQNVSRRQTMTDLALLSRNKVMHDPLQISTLSPWRPKTVKSYFIFSNMIACVDDMISYVLHVASYV